MTGKRIGLLVGGASALLVAAFGGVASQARPARTAPRPAARVASPTTSAGSHESGIHYTSKTIVISRAFVRHNLIGISKAGIFKWKRDTGPLTQLKRGKVM